MKRDISIIKGFLIPLTIAQIVGLALMFIEVDHLMLEISSLMHYFFFYYSIVLVGICIWYNWKRLPIEDKKKKDNTWMLVLLGIIGLGIIAMWIWVPNRRELKEFKTAN